MCLVRRAPLAFLSSSLSFSRPGELHYIPECMKLTRTASILVRLQVFQYTKHGQLSLGIPEIQTPLGRAYIQAPYRVKLTFMTVAAK